MLRYAYNKRVDPPMISASIPSVSCSRARMSARIGLAIGQDSEIGGDANMVYMPGRERLTRHCFLGQIRFVRPFGSNSCPHDRHLRLGKDTSPSASFFFFAT
jgi:hypothetical protein